MENFIWNQYGERLAIVNIKYQSFWMNYKVGAIKMLFVFVFFHICRKFEFLISQDSVATCLRRDG